MASRGWESYAVPVLRGDRTARRRVEPRAGGAVRASMVGDETPTGRLIAGTRVCVRGSFGDWFTARQVARRVAVTVLFTSDLTLRTAERRLELSRPGRVARRRRAQK